VRLAFESPGKNLHRIGFLARRDDFRLAGPTAIKFGLNIRFSQCQTWWATIYNDAYAAAVRFTPRGDAKEMTERIAHAEQWQKPSVKVKPPRE
jgi:hypothetical protein